MRQATAISSGAARSRRCCCCRPSRSFCRRRCRLSWRRDHQRSHSQTRWQRRQRLLDRVMGASPRRCWRPHWVLSGSPGSARSSHAPGSAQSSLPVLKRRSRRFALPAGDWPDCTGCALRVWTAATVLSCSALCGPSFCCPPVPKAGRWTVCVRCCCTKWPMCAGAMRWCSRSQHSHPRCAGPIRWCGWRCGACGATRKSRPMTACSPPV